MTSDRSHRRTRLLLVAGVIQVALAATAWADLATRPAALVVGRKGVRGMVIAVNFVGPLAYFLRGRRVVAPG